MHLAQQHAAAHAVVKLFRRGAPVRAVNKTSQALPECLEIVAGKLTEYPDFGSRPNASARSKKSHHCSMKYYVAGVQVGRNNVRGMTTKK